MVLRKYFKYPLRILFMKICPICKRNLSGTKRWYYRYKMCKICALRLRKEGKAEKYDTWKTN